MQLDHKQNIIELKDISFRYGSEVVLENISLNVHKGDYLGVIGPNGGGKTTLLKVILGLLSPTSGSVSLFGQDIVKFRDWSKIGYVPQKVVHFDATFPATVEEVVAMGRYGRIGLFRWPTQKDKASVAEALKEVEMYNYRQRLIGDLSSGQQQRVFIARALAGEPEVIFLDEPTVGVDAPTQERFYELLKKLNRDMQLTLVLVSHDIDVIANEVTEFACVNRSLVYHGQPAEFIKGDYLQRLYGKDVKFIIHGH